MVPLKADFAQPLVQTIKRLRIQVKGKSRNFFTKISKKQQFSNQELVFSELVVLSAAIFALLHSK
jgi:hypothetical protein